VWILYDDLWVWDERYQLETPFVDNNPVVVVASLVAELEVNLSSLYPQWYDGSIEALSRPFVDDTLPPPFVVATTEALSGTGVDVGASGDYLVAEVVSDTTTLTQPSGWTLITGSTTSWGGGGLKYTAWQIQRGATAPALTWSAINVFSVVITAIRHPLAYTPTFNAAANSALATTTADSPSLTTTTSNAMVLLGLGLSSTATITPPSGFSVTLNDGTNGLAAVNKVQASAGATGVNTWALSTTDNSVSSTITIDYSAASGLITLVGNSLDLNDVSNTQITSTSPVSSATADGLDLSNAQLSTVNNLSSNTFDGLDLSNALISPIQSGSVSSSTTDGLDVSNASLSNTVAISSATTDLQDVSNAQLTSTSPVSSSTSDGLDSSTATVSPTAAITSTTSDYLDIANSNISPTVSASSITTDSLDVGNAQLNSTVSVTSATSDGLDLSNALLSPTVTTNNLSGASFDGVDLSNALLSPINALSGESFDGADVIGLFVEQPNTQVSGNPNQGLYPKERLKRKKQQDNSVELSEQDAEIKALLEIVQEKSKKTVKSRRSAEMLAIKPLEMPITQQEEPKRIYLGVLQQKNYLISDDDIEMIIALMLEMI
jgi:hypothetical protein